MEVYYHDNKGNVRRISWVDIPRLLDDKGLYAIRRDWSDQTDPQGVKREKLIEKLWKLKDEKKVHIIGPHNQFPLTEGT